MANVLKKGLVMFSECLACWAIWQLKFGYFFSIIQIQQVSDNNKLW